MEYSKELDIATFLHFRKTRKRLKSSTKMLVNRHKSAIRTREIMINNRKGPN